MKRLGFSITLAAMMVVAATTLTTATTPAAAASVVARVEITPEKVAKSGAWQDLAEAIGLPWEILFADADGQPIGKKESLPMPLVGQMYGGAWGTRGSSLKQVLPEGWRTWGGAVNDDGEIPGVSAVLPAEAGNVVVHAERGSGNEVFLFVGTRSAATGTKARTLATMMQTAIDGKDPEGWNVFCAAVERTPTGTSAIRTEKATKILAAMHGCTISKDGTLLQDGKPVAVVAVAGESLSASKAKGAKPRDPRWALVGLISVTLLIVGLSVSLIRRMWKKRKAANSEPPPPPAAEEDSGGAPVPEDDWKGLDLRGRGEDGSSEPPPEPAGEDE
jgi:hypothetical protein